MRYRQIHTMRLTTSATSTEEKFDKIKVRFTKFSNKRKKSSD